MKLTIELHSGIPMVDLRFVQGLAWLPDYWWSLEFNECAELCWFLQGAGKVLLGASLLGVHSNEGPYPYEMIVPDPIPSSTKQQRFSRPTCLIPSIKDILCSFS